MGKASRWIRNLLIGKKEGKSNDKKDVSSSHSLVTGEGTTITPAATSLQRRRWSFGRSVSTEKAEASHKSCRSFDSIVTSQLVSETSLEYAIQQQNNTTIVVEPPRQAATRTAQKTAGPVEHAAATKLQACFRSYLARKALCALRGLVKVQAVVRGHLVRKQTAAMVRCMNALMAIQVRARFQRIQMAELHLTKTITDNMSQDQVKDVRIDETRGRFISNPQTPVSERSLDTPCSRRHHIQLYPPDSSPSTNTSSTRYYDKQVEEVSSSRAGRMSFHHGEPNYMNRTESSRAKVRSQSEPKQRPIKQKSKSRRTASNEGLTAITHEIQTQISSTSSVAHQKNQNRWLVKLYRSSKSIKDIKFGSASSGPDNSSYCRTFYAYEPAVNLY